MGVGVIAPKGIVQASMCNTVPSIIDLTVAETMAAWKVVVFYIEMGYQRVYIEGEELEIVHILKGVGMVN